MKALLLTLKQKNRLNLYFRVLIQSSTKRVLVRTISALLIIISVSLLGQSPESFFPSQVGNLWVYERNAPTVLEDWSILQDSLDNNGNRYLYARIIRTGEEYWRYKIDSVNVYQGGDPWPYKIYNLDADSGDVWIFGPYYAWVAGIDSVLVFGEPTIMKIIRVGPEYPDSNWSNFYYQEQYLASGFGVIYHWEEPGNVAFLRGCIVAGDTFGTVTSVNSIMPILPDKFILHQNYPNPFNPTTTIEFSLPYKSYVKLSVIDLLGREVAVLTDAKLIAGTHKIIFDGSHLPSGVYFVRLKANDMVLTRKMTLLK